MNLQTVDPGPARRLPVETAHVLQRTQAVALSTPPGGSDDDPPSSGRPRRRAKSTSAAIKHNGATAGVSTGHILH